MTDKSNVSIYLGERPNVQALFGLMLLVFFGGKGRQFDVHGEKKVCIRVQKGLRGVRYVVGGGAEKFFEGDKLAGQVIDYLLLGKVPVLQQFLRYYVEKKVANNPFDGAPMCAGLFYHESFEDAIDMTLRLFRSYLIGQKEVTDQIPTVVGMKREDVAGKQIRSGKVSSVLVGKAARTMDIAFVVMELPDAVRIQGNRKFGAADILERLHEVLEEREPNVWYFDPAQPAIGTHDEKSTALSLGNITQLLKEQCAPQRPSIGDNGILERLKAHGIDVEGRRHGASDSVCVAQV